MDGWVGGWVDGWMGGWVDGWMDGWVDGWVDGWMEVGENISMLQMQKTEINFPWGLNIHLSGMQQRISRIGKWILT